MMKTTILSLSIAICTFLFAGCLSKKQPTPVPVAVDTAAIKRSIAATPVLPAQESIRRMKVENGFKVLEVASEPLIVAPVAMVFDDHARLWTIEMQGYMPDTMGTGENKPSCRIVILEDTNHDGVMDTRRVFLDNLVMPRALCLADNGLLVAEPPRLWFVPAHDLHAGKKILIDSQYTNGGNPEHQPNGLSRALDNWIYSADSDKRYRKVNGKWKTEPTVPRGQWGISQDDRGRLFYNNNSQNLMGDYFSPSFGKAENIPGYNEDVVVDNSVFPARPTPGVNRGYMKGILDDSLRLRNFTAASGPVIYRGNIFGKEYDQNAFVAEPSANLIKRDILKDSGYQVVGREAWHGKEFLASTDERFRPVTLYNGPDGALYVLDMYRGIIQHKTYLTDYLKGEIRSRALSSPLDCGRIYKVVPEDFHDTAIIFPSDPPQLVKLLGHANGWVRDKAQQLLVDGKYRQVTDLLRKNIYSMGQPLAAIHSFWTLEGLNALRAEDVMAWIDGGPVTLQEQALTAIPSVIDRHNYKKLLQCIDTLIGKKDSLTAPYMGFLVEDFRKMDTAAANRLEQKLRNNFPSNKYVTGSLTYMKRNESQMSDKVKNAFPQGFKLFNTVCKTCHGADGNGVKSLAPPLNGSEWVNGSKDKLISIVLKGLSGPIKVKGKLYAPPAISGEMPGLGSNPEFSDEQIAQVLSLIRQSWKNASSPVSADEVKRGRK